jgi:hypothetical protein
MIVYVLREFPNIEKRTKNLKKALSFFPFFPSYALGFFSLRLDIYIVVDCERTKDIYSQR